MHKKSCSERNLLKNIYHEKQSLIALDPFQNMKILKKSNPVLRPICHKRASSDTIGNKLIYSGNSKIIEKRTDIALLTPRIQKTVFDCQIYAKPYHTQQTNPLFLEVKSQNDMQINEYKNPALQQQGSRNFMLNKKVVKRVTNLIQNHQNKNDKRSEMEFSFGK